MKIDTGSYTGDGSDPKTISLTNCDGDLTGTDSFVLVVAKEADEHAQWTTDQFDSGYSKPIAGSAGVQVSGLISLGTGQFTVSGNLNVNTSTYYYLVCQHDGTNDDIQTGQYTGNKTDDEQGLITFPSGLCDAVFIGPESSYNCHARISDAVGDISREYDNGDSVDGIQDIGSTYVELGTNNEVNRSGYIYNYVLFKNVTGVTHFFLYEGTGADHDETAPGFDPDFVWVSRNVGDDSPMRERSITTDNSPRLRAAVSDSDKIEDWVTDGFNVGTHAEANASGSDYYAWVFKKSAGAAAGGLSIPIAMNYYKQRRR